MPLYESADKGAIVGVAPQGSLVHVIGTVPRTADSDHTPQRLLVRTSLGLVGWHVWTAGELADGQIDIYSCN